MPPTPPCPLTPPTLPQQVLIEHPLSAVGSQGLEWQTGPWLPQQADPHVCGGSRGSDAPKAGAPRAWATGLAAPTPARSWGTSHTGSGLRADMTRPPPALTVFEPLEDGGPRPRRCPDPSVPLPGCPGGMGDIYENIPGGGGEGGKEPCVVENLGAGRA